ncbi:GNAT family N-acetyltransferase [Fusibacter bizertensis]
MPKVKLRDLIINDVEDRYNWSMDREVTQFLSVPEKFPPFTKEETTKWIQTCIDGTNGYIQKSILSEYNDHIGWVDLKNFDKVNNNAELGITIGNKAYWGQGYGSAAIKEMLHYGFEKLNLHKIWLRVDRDNEKAIKSYKKIGFIEEGILREDRFRRGEYIDRVRFSILKSELS